MELLKIRLFGSSDCNNCNILKQSLKYYDLSYDFVDVNDKKNDKLCDILNIDEIPVIQILSSSDNRVISSHIGLIDPMKFLKRFSASKNISKSRNSNKKGCNNCYD